MENFGHYLYQLRTKKEKYISQQKLAKLSGYTQTYISLIETGKAQPSRGCQRLLLDVFGVTKPAYSKLYNAI